MNPNILVLNNVAKLIAPTTSGMRFITLSDVVYFESDNIYSYLFLQNGEKINVFSSIKCLETHCCSKDLIRIHKKYIISISKVSLYCKSEGGYVVLNETIQLPISRYRRSEFMERLGV